MLISIIVKYIHFIGIFGIVISLSIENVLLKETHTRQELKRLAKIDSLYGFSAIIVLAAGFTLWMGVGKPAEFYSSNPLIWIKLGLFAIVGILSLPPTLFFIRNRAKKGETGGEKVLIPIYLRKLIRVELIILFLLPLLATLMANGIGQN